MSRFFRILIVSASLIFIAACVPQHRAPAGESAPIEYFEHQVNFNGETLALIAKWYTGDADNWNEILAHNPGLDVRRMSIGQIIKIPRSMVTKEAKLTRAALGSGTTKTSNAPAPEVKKPTAKSEATNSKSANQQSLDQESKPEKDHKKKALKSVLDEISEDQDATAKNEPVATATPQAAPTVVQTLEPHLEQVKKEATKPVATPSHAAAPTQDDSKPKTRYDLLKELLEQKQ